MTQPEQAENQDYRAWHIPLRRDQLTLGQAREDLASVGAGQEEVPLMVQLVENPRYRIPGFELFHGAVDLPQHDAIHIALGRGLLPKDEAFTIGFTMGSTKKVGTIEEELFGVVSRFLYPQFYQFDRDDIGVFKNAVRLAYISRCQPLDEWDFSPYLDRPLAELRTDLGLETDLLLAYYGIERQRHPDCPESQRLLNP